MRYSWDMAKDAKQIMQHFPPALDAQVTLANWAPACRVLIDNVDESYAIFFLV